jgi:hypothetical protein
MRLAPTAWSYPGAWPELVKGPDVGKAKHALMVRQKNRGFDDVVGAIAESIAHSDRTYRRFVPIADRLDAFCQGVHGAASLDALTADIARFLIGRGGEGQPNVATMPRTPGGLSRCHLDERDPWRT